MRRRWILALLLWGLLGAQPAVAEESWQPQLQAEIRHRLDCEVAYLSHVVERSIEGRQLVMVKVHCIDQRSFDALRQDRAAAFLFKECTRETKETC